MNQKCLEPDQASVATVGLMTDEDVAARHAALVAAAELRQQMLDRRGGQPLAESWPLIREAREERSSRI